MENFALEVGCSDGMMRIAEAVLWLFGTRPDRASSQLQEKVCYVVFVDDPRTWPLVAVDRVWADGRGMLEKGWVYRQAKCSYCVYRMA